MFWVRTRGKQTASMPTTPEPEKSLRGRAHATNPPPLPPMARAGGIGKGRQQGDSIHPGARSLWELVGEDMPFVTWVNWVGKPKIAVMASSVYRLVKPNTVRDTPSPVFNISSGAMFDLSKSRLTLDDPRVIFEKLGEDFGIHKDVIRHMVVVCQMQSLDDFRVYFCQ